MSRYSQARELEAINKHWWRVRLNFLNPRHFRWCNASPPSEPWTGRCKFRSGHPHPHLNSFGRTWVDG